MARNDTEFLQALWTNETDLLALDHNPAVVCFFMGCVSACTIFGNSLVIASSIHCQRLRSTSNFLICSLASADLLLGLFVMPFHIVDRAHGFWPLGLAVCDFWHCLDVLASTASIWNLCVISLDRYLAVRDPLTYRSIMSSRRAQGAVCCVWFFSSLLAFPAVAWWRLDSPEVYSVPTDCQFTTSYSFLVTSSLLSFYMPLIIMLFAYCKVYTAAASYEKSLRLGTKHMPRKGQKTIQMRVHRGKATISNASDRKLFRREQSVDQSNHIVNETSPLSIKESASTGMLDKKVTIQEEESDSSDITPFHMDDRCISVINHSNMDTIITVNRSVSTGNNRKSQKVTKQWNSLQTRINRFAREKKAAKTLGIVMGCFVGCWCPFFIFNIVESAWPQVFDGKRIVFEVTTWLGYCNSFLNPAIYAWHSIEYRTAFKSLLRKLCLCGASRSSTFSSISASNRKPSKMAANTSAYGSIITKRSDEFEEREISQRSRRSSPMRKIYTPVTPAEL